MYTRCIHCHGALGQNEEVEHFPVGRRLAFDASRGRLWVVCPVCLRWNLTPLEERWEAIEECERLFHDARRRYSTDQIGVARLGSGFSIIRVGRPLRAEFAAWRYGERFSRRRRRFIVRSSVVAAAAIAGQVSLMLGPTVVLLGVALADATLRRMAGPYLKQRVTTRVVARARTVDGSPVTVRRGDLARLDVVAGEGGSWALRLPGAGEGERFVGEDALRLGALALAERNVEGATDDQVRMAVDKLEWFNGPDGLLRFAIDRGGLAKLGNEQLLAIEMALHEESERRALEGELAVLEQAWREAEELAAIADDLLLPEAVTQWMRRHMRGG